MHESHCRIRRRNPLRLVLHAARATIQHLANNRNCVARLSDLDGWLERDVGAESLHRGVDAFAAGQQLGKSSAA
jgi:hypothetical protein